MSFSEATLDANIHSENLEEFKCRIVFGFVLQNMNDSSSSANYDAWTIDKYKWMNFVKATKCSTNTITVSPVKSTNTISVSPNENECA